METKSAGIVGMMRADVEAHVEARYPHMGAGATRYRHVGQLGAANENAKRREMLRYLSGLEGKEGLLNDRMAAKQLPSAQEEGPLSERFVDALRELTDDTVGEAVRKNLAVHLRGSAELLMAPVSVGDTGALITGVTLLHAAGGALHPADGNLQAAQERDIHLLVQILAFQGMTDRETMQKFFHQHADPVVQKAETIRRLEAAGRTYVQELKPDAMPVVSLVGLSKGDQVQAAAYILGVAKALQEKGDRRKVLVPGVGADWELLHKLNAQLNGLRGNIQPVSGMQAGGLIAAQSLNVKALADYAKDQKLFPDQGHPSLDLVAKLENVDEASVEAAKRDGVSVEKRDFISIVKAIGDEIARLAYILLQA